MAAALLLIGTYYVFDLDYPVIYAQFWAFSSTGWLGTFSLRAKEPSVFVSMTSLDLLMSKNKNCLQTKYIYFCFSFNRTHMQGENKYDFIERSIRVKCLTLKLKLTR